MSREIKNEERVTQLYWGRVVLDSQVGLESRRLFSEGGESETRSKVESNMISGGTLPFDYVLRSLGVRLECADDSLRDHIAAETVARLEVNCKAYLELPFSLVRDSVLFVNLLQPIEIPARTPVVLHLDFSPEVTEELSRRDHWEFRVTGYLLGELFRPVV
jgi:hypothetical protein